MTLNVKNRFVGLSRGNIIRGFLDQLISHLPSHTIFIGNQILPSAAMEFLDSPSTTMNLPIPCVTYYLLPTVITCYSSITNRYSFQSKQ